MEKPLINENQVTEEIMSNQRLKRNTWFKKKLEYLKNINETTSIEKLKLSLNLCVDYKQPFWTKINNLSYKGKIVVVAIQKRHFQLKISSNK